MTQPHITRFLILIAALWAGLAGAARAETSALIALGVGAPSDLARVLEAQEVIERRHGFDRVEVLTDATADEVYARARAFLEAPALPGDRRFLWISGIVSIIDGRGARATMCPAGDGAPLKPTAMSLILAPGCIADMVDLPASAIHVSRGRMTPQQLARRLRFSRRGGAVPDANAHAPANAIAVLPLPGTDPVAVASADGAVIDALAGARGIVLHPLAVLDSLRARFPRDRAEAGFRPTLDVAGWYARFVEPSWPGQRARRAADIKRDGRSGGG